MAKDVEPTSVWDWLQAWADRALQIIDLRLALVIGLITFLVAVSFDSAGNSAEAADLTQAGSFVPIPVRVVSVNPGLSASLGTVAQISNPTQDESWATARRLRHGMMTSAIMTSNRLTEAHFFTDLQSGD